MNSAPVAMTAGERKKTCRSLPPKRRLAIGSKAIASMASSKESALKARSSSQRFNAIAAI
jgi:hypothetical protein